MRNNTVVYSSSSELSVGEKVERILSEMGGMSKFVKPGNLVLIKPNFVAPFAHATTSLEVLEAIIDAVKRCGGRPVIAESAGYEFDTEATFKILGAYEFARKVGVDLINLDKVQYKSVRLTRGLVRELKIPKLVLDADLLINVPKLKRHSLTGMTIGAKNLIGLVHRESRCRIHCLGLERGIFELTKLIPSHLVIVDGTVISESAVFGAQHHLNLIVGSDSVYAADLFCCRFLGVHARGVGHIRLSMDDGLISHEFTAISTEVKWPSREMPETDLKEFVSKGNRLVRKVYQLMYCLEIMYSRIMKGRSLIPAAHFYFGIRPWLDRNACNDCGACVTVCPVNAITIPERKIDASLCMRLRCMKCVSVCSRGAIRVRGRKAVDADRHAIPYLS